MADRWADTLWRHERDLPSPRRTGRTDSPRLALAAMNSDPEVRAVRTAGGGRYCLLVVTDEVFILFMKAAKLLDQVKALPRAGRKDASSARKEGKRVEWPDVQARTKRIFGDRVLPNLVLLEREEEPA